MAKYIPLIDTNIPSHLTNHRRASSPVSGQRLQLGGSMVAVVSRDVCGEAVTTAAANAT